MAVKKMAFYGGAPMGTFRKPISHIKKLRIRILVTAILVALAALGSVIFTQSGYAVRYNGQILGSAKTVDEITETIQAVETQASQLLGTSYTLDGEFEIVTAAGAKADSDLEKALLASVPEIKLMYVLQIDGQSVAGAESEETISSTIDAVMAEYASGPSAKVSFDNEIVIAYDYAPVTLEMGMEDIADVIDPVSPTATCPVTVRCMAYEDHTAEIPYELETAEDGEAYEGTSNMTQEGVNGLSEITESVVYVNGKEISRKATKAVTILQPTTEITTIGTKERPYYMSYGEYIWPAEGVLTSYFGYRNISIGSSNHGGIDIGGDYRSNVNAADGGEVIFAGENYGYGYLVRVLHDNGEETWYAHCDELCVQEGDLVGRGQQLGYMGSTGNSTGVHLHFEVVVNGEKTDPMDHLPE